MRSSAVRVVLIGLTLLPLSLACSGSVEGGGDAGPGRDGVGLPDGGGSLLDAARDGEGVDSARVDATRRDGSGSPDSAPPPPPQPVDPCALGACWPAPGLGAACGSSTVSEDFSSGKYNVHSYALTARQGVAVDVTLKATAGAWHPALIVHDASGTTVYDGERGLASATLAVVPGASGRGASSATFRVTAQADTALKIFVSAWSVVDGGFTPFLPTSATYDVIVVANCTPPTPGTLLSPPNFDPNDQDAKGYYLLPPSSPAGLYTRKPDDCSRGNKLLIDVLYTVATRWKQQRPALSPIAILDLNEGSCSSVDHATHDDGTHADLTAGCATQVACTDNQPAIELAKLFADTGEVCGIINNDTAVQAVVNAYFTSKYSYAPWHGTFMRSVTGHTQHFHIRVKKPDGTCN